MVKKLRQSIFWKNYNLYEKIVKQCSMRYTVDAYIYFAILQKYNFKNILEIGFIKGKLVDCC